MSSGKLTADYDPDWPGITTLLAGNYGHMQAKSENPNSPFHLEMKDSALLDLKKNIEQLLDSTFDTHFFSAYSDRTRLYHYWMMLAKKLSESVDIGIIRVQAWKKMEEDRGGRNLDPEPFYHEIALLYLNALSGSEQAKEKIRSATAKMTQMIEDHRYSKSRGNLYKIRDVFVKGREMGQLLDLSYCQREDDCYTFLSNPQEFEGILEEAYSGYAMIKTYSPLTLSGEFVKVSIGRRADNSLSEQQIGHHIRFYAGLSLEAITALSKSAKDYSSDEKLDLAVLQNRGNPNQVNSRSESARNHRSEVVHRETPEQIDITHAGGSQNDTKEFFEANPAVLSVQKTEILKIGLVVSLLPQNITENGYLGIFVHDGAQYKGQINLEKMKQKKKAKSLYKQLADALGKNIAVQGFRIIGEPKDGVYPLQYV